MIRAAWILALAAPSSPGVAQAEDPQAAFVDVTESALPGVEVICGAADKRWIAEVNGGGLGLEDLNADGFLDLVVVDGSTMAAFEAGRTGRPPRVFFGQQGGSFQAAPESWKMKPLPWGTGLALGDVDRDGWCDVCVLSMDGLVVYRNAAGQGLVPFEESGLPAPGRLTHSWLTSAGFFDANGDGHLDLYVARYLEFDPEQVPGHGEQGARWKGHPVLFGPQGMTPQSDLLYLGAGDGTFVDHTETAGLLAAKPAFGLGVVCRDLDGDGDTDVYVSNDSMPNHLWRNDGQGNFTEVGFAAGVSHGPDGREQAGMGIACAALQGAATPSLFVTNFSAESNAFYQPGRRAGRYRDRASKLGITTASKALLGWGTGFTDWNRDGRLDLWVLNGHVYPEADLAGTDTSYAQPDQLFVQAESGAFVPQPLHAGAARVSRTGVAGDLDRDGDEDLVVWTMEGRLQVLQNQAPPHANWIGLGFERARVPAGTRVVVRDGDHVQTFECQRSAGFQASQPAERVVGLQSSEGPVKVEITTPAPHSKTVRFERTRGAWYKLDLSSQ